MIIIKRNGRIYYGCADCGRKFISITNLDGHKCAFKAEPINSEPKGA